MKKGGKSGASLTVRQTRSACGRNQEVHKTLNCLGLGRVGDKRQHVESPALRGMIRRVAHLVEVQSS